MRKSVFVIAEAGVNHNGSLEMAKQLVDVAVEAGADAVKFQTFKASKLVTQTADKATYQKEHTGSQESQYEMIRKLELGARAHKILLDYCNKKKIQFLSTPFDSDSIELLKELGITTYKIPSGEITNLPYLRQIAGVASRVILSTGMSTLGEVESALQVLQDTGLSKEKITVLHATTEYPCPMSEVNLKAMTTIAAAFEVSVGYSDHTEGIEATISAVALGGSIIEKHFTLDRSLPGPDHKASLEPKELKAMVKAIRNIEQALGDGIKRPSMSETKNRSVARKSLVAASAIQAGDLFTAENITTKRPNTGISPMRWDEIIGRTAGRNYVVDELINI
jgi:N,N'-diacetyllegionaminate synthase